MRGVGGLVVAPPSRHKSGARYEINESAILPVPCPERLLLLMQEQQEAQARQSGQATSAVEAGLGAGKRTPILSALIGKLHSQGVPQASIEAAAVALNTTFAPPHPEEKIRRMVRDMCARYRAGSLPNTASELKPDLVRLADVEARAVRWLWEPFMALGMLTMLSGDPGTGKSFIALAVAADLTRGKLRDARLIEPASVLYLSIENPIAEAIRPRFDLLGGDPSRFFVLKGTRFSENGEEQQGAVTLADISILDAAIRQTGARLIVIDPIQSYLGAAVDLHRSNETRPVLDGLSKLAEGHGCAILLLRHLSKQSGGRPIHRGLGSIDLTGAVRSELLAGSLPDDEQARALVHVKSNVGRIGRTQGYSIDGEGRFSWTGESAITASELLAAPEAPENRTAREDATQWLSDLLKDGSREQKEVRNLAESAGIRYRTLRRAKDTLGVRSYKAGMSGAWLWALPEGAHDSAQGVHTKNMDTFANVDTFEGGQETTKGANEKDISLLDSEEGHSGCVRPSLDTFDFGDIAGSLRRVQ